MKPAKIACVALSDFAVEVCRRDHPELKGRPFALADGPTEAAEIIAIDAEAARRGVLLNVTVAQGHILCPGLTVMVRDHEREIEQSNSLYKKLQSLSPFVEEARPGLYFLDASGFELLYGNDEAFAAQIIATVRSHGPEPYEVKVGLGANQFIAQLAADLTPPDGCTIVADGCEQQFLHPLPVERLQTDTLRLSSETLENLRDLGLRTIGQVAAFPANEMIRRFGPQGEVLSQLARGHDPAFFVPEAPTEPLARTTWCDLPLESRNAILALAGILLDPLLTELGRYSAGCSTVEITLHPDRRSLPPTTFPVTVERPTLSAKTFLRQLGTILEKRKLAAPVAGLTVAVPATTALLSEQLPLGDQVAPARQTPHHLPDTTAVVARPLCHDLFLPEHRFSFGDPSAPVRPKSDPAAPAWSRRPAFTNRAVTGLRLLPSPREITVRCDHHRPIAIDRTGVQCDGPWELSGRWWHDDYDRLYWEACMADRKCYLIYHDRRTDRWFLQGVFD